ncbi:hypothetical protein AB3S75_023323 [Citrus x aurantiifolia]
MRIRRRHSFFKSFLLSLLLEVQKLIHKLDLTILNLLWLSTGALSRLILSDDSLRMAVNEFRTSKASWDLTQVIIQVEQNIHKIDHLIHETKAIVRASIGESFTRHEF